MATAEFRVPFFTFHRGLNCSNTLTCNSSTDSHSHHTSDQTKAQKANRVTLSRTLISDDKVISSLTITHVFDFASVFWCFWAKYLTQFVLWTILPKQLVRCVENIIERTFGGRTDIWSLRDNPPRDTFGNLWTITFVNSSCQSVFTHLERLCCSTELSLCSLRGRWCFHKSNVFYTHDVTQDNDD